jgi:hypothetical protein
VKLFELLSRLVDGDWPDDRSADVAAPGNEADGIYVLERRLAAGDVADIHLGRIENDPTDASYLVKVARDKPGSRRLDNEQRTLANLHAEAGDTTYRKYLPAPVESFATDGIRANVFLYEPGFFTLEQVHEQHPALDGRHLAWIFKRLLTVLGFVHRQEAIHAAVLPCHVLLEAANHGLRLVGWGQSVELGQPIAATASPYAGWYPREVLEREAAGPATDIYMAAKCVVYLAGGDVPRNRMPDSVPTEMRRFIRTCLFDGIQMRPDDAWALLDEFDELLQRLYGPPRFHELTLT